MKGDAFDQVGGVVGDTLDPPGVELCGVDQADVIDGEVLRDPHGGGDVDEVLGFDEN